MNKEIKHPCKIQKLSHDGRGIALLNGKTTFISGALPDEEVEFKYTKKHSNYDEAETTTVLHRSPDRVDPACPHFNLCGGCSLQHMSHATQLQLKQQTLLEQLQHFGHVQPSNVLDPITGSIWGYRHKARLGVKYVNKKQRLLIGFREKNGRYIADIDSCQVLHSSVGHNLVKLRDLIANLSCYRDIPQVEVAIDDTVTAFIIRHLQPLTDTDLKLLQYFHDQYGYHIYLQPKGMDTIHRVAPLNAPEYLSYAIDSLTIQFKPENFTQINPEINRKMIKRAIELLEPAQDDSILDLFCGIGNFTLPLATLCNSTVGVEGSETAVTQAKLNANLNNIKNASFYTADLSQDIFNLSWAKQQYDKILLDPPRSGALEVIKSITRFKAKQILYVSCNPATLGRDAGELNAQGYKLISAGIIDMFPHTQHVESIALFRK